MNYRVQVKLVNNEVLFFLVDQDSFDILRNRLDDKKCDYLSFDPIRVMKSAVLFISWDEDKSIK